VPVWIVADHGSRTGVTFLAGTKAGKILVGANIANGCCNGCTCAWTDRCGTKGMCSSLLWRTPSGASKDRMREISARPARHRQDPFRFKLADPCNQGVRGSRSLSAGTSHDKTGRGRHFLLSSEDIWGNRSYRVDYAAVDCIKRLAEAAWCRDSAGDHHGKARQTIDSVLGSTGLTACARYRADFSAQGANRVLTVIVVMLRRVTASSN